MQTFLDAGCGPELDYLENIGGNLSALHVAAEEGHSRATGALIRAGANVNLADGHGRTPLHCAAQQGKAKVVVDLLLNGADKEAENDEGMYAHDHGSPLYDLGLPDGADIFLICAIDSSSSCSRKICVMIWCMSVAHTFWVGCALCTGPVQHFLAVG